MRRIRERLRTEMRSLRGANAEAVIRRLNPIIRGWAAYYRRWSPARRSTRWMTTCGQLTYKWASYSHPNKPKRWVVARYFGMFNHSRRDRWVFGDRESGAYLPKFAWTRIVRHQLVKGTSSPDDPALADYWADDDARTPPPTAGKTTCGSYKPRMAAARSAGTGSCRRRPATKPTRVGALAGNQPHDDRPRRRAEDGTPDEQEPRLIHAHCRTQHTTSAPTPGTSARPRAHRACLSRMRGNPHVRF